jgi:flagellar biosynthetic protein FliR
MELNFANLIAPLVAVGLRVSGLMLFAPVFGSAALPPRIKAVLAIVLTAALYPALSTKIPAVSLAMWPLVVLHELAIGVAVGLAANLVFDAAQLAGQVMSVQMGLSLASILDPQTQAESTVVALFHQTIALLIFLSLDVHHALLRAVAASFEFLPVSMARIGAPFVAATLKLGAGVFTLGLQIAAPVLAATMIADVVIGLLGKASPQMPLMLLGPALKSLLGAAILLGVVRYWPDFMARGFRASLVYVEQLLHLAR